ncbi:MAG: hypothetical protein JWO33_433 [Caulobacteraceae bacterium]|nr:hypothetical protein [Caulobacteraceae bacterium]
MNPLHGRLLLAGAVLFAPLSAARGEVAAEAAAADAPSLTAAAVTPAASRPIVTQAPVFTEDDQLLFAVVSGQLQLSESFDAYSSRAGVFLPIGALARLIDINIEVDPQRQRATGWVVSPQRTILIDIPGKRLAIGGVEGSLSEADAVYKDGDSYVRDSALEKILPLNIVADTSGLNLTLTPTEKLPFQDRLERELRATQLGGRSEDGGPLLVPTPYRLFTPPSLDINLNLGVGNSDPRSTGNYDARLAGDFLGGGLQLFAGSDSDFKLSSARALLSRKDPQGKIAGPFGATRSSLGDTFTPTMTLGARSASGRGFAISSVPLEQASVFDRIDLRGELPLGYQVELYVNEVLQGSQAQPVQGRYEFQQISLAYGLNTIRLVFYGPRGERREDVRRINVGGGQLKKGQTTYSLGAVQTGLTVFGVGDDDLGGVPGQGEWRVSGSIAHGITDTATLIAGYARYTPALDDPRQIGSLGITTSVAGSAVQVDAAADDQGGAAVSAAFAGRYGHTSVVGRHAEYSGGFVDEVQGGGSGGAVTVQRSTALSIDTLIGLFGSDIPASFRVARDEFTDGAQDIRTDVRFSRPFGRYLFSTALQYQHRSGNGDSFDNLLGAMDLSGLVGGKWQLRAGTAYTIAPEFKVQSATVTADRNFGEFTALHLGVNHTFGPDDTRFEVGETWRLKQADVSLIGAYGTRQKDLRVGLQLSMGFGYDPWRGRYGVLGPGAASGGSIALDAFMDDNGNGLRDPGEKPLPGVLVQGGRRPEKTDANGHVLITGLGDSAYGQASIDISSLDDPYLLPSAPVVQVVPRPGRVARIPYPVTVSGEVELNVAFQRPGQNTRGISALHLELVGADGKVAATGSSEYDGSLLIENIKPGVYQVRIEPAQAERLKMELIRPVSVTVKPGGGFAGKVTVPVTARTPVAPPEGAAK